MRPLHIYIFGLNEIIVKLPNVKNMIPIVYSEIKISVRHFQLFK